MRTAIYARVSTNDQTCENQLIELRRYCESRGWTPQEFVDQGVSGAKESRPALDALLKDARRRRLDAVVVWRLDRLGRSLRHLILTLDELSALGVAFVSLGEGVDTSTPAGRLQLHILGAIAEFERERIRGRILVGLERARRAAETAWATPRHPAKTAVPGGSVRAAATVWGVSKTTAAKWIAEGKAPRRERLPLVLRCCRVSRQRP
jgi:DNA invertase Pin-like site-specific DNA recombinase